MSDTFERGQVVHYRFCDWTVRDVNLDNDGNVFSLNLDAEISGIRWTTCVSPLDVTLVHESPHRQGATT